MKMDRNVNLDGTGKYALLNLRPLSNGMEALDIAVAQDAIKRLEQLGILEWGNTGSEHEFFVIKLKDAHSLPALQAYADSIAGRDAEFAEEVREMAGRAGPSSPWYKEPD